MTKMQTIPCETVISTTALLYVASSKWSTNRKLAFHYLFIDFVNKKLLNQINGNSRLFIYNQCDFLPANSLSVHH